jgi:hypothetical protein
MLLFTANKFALLINIDERNTCAFLCGCCCCCCWFLWLDCVRCRLSTKSQKETKRIYEKVSSISYWYSFNEMKITIATKKDETKERIDFDKIACMRLNLHFILIGWRLTKTKDKTNMSTRAYNWSRNRFATCTTKWLTLKSNHRSNKPRFVFLPIVLLFFITHDKNSICNRLSLTLSLSLSHLFYVQQTNGRTNSIGYDTAFLRASSQHKSSVLIDLNVGTAYRTWSSIVKETLMFTHEPVLWRKNATSMSMTFFDTLEIIIIYFSCFVCNSSSTQQNEKIYH